MLAAHSPGLTLDLKSLPPGTSAKIVTVSPGPDTPIGVIGTVAAAAAGGGQGGSDPKVTAYVTVTMPDGITRIIAATGDTKEEAIKALREVLKNYKPQTEDYSTTIPDVKLIADPNECVEMQAGTMTVPEQQDDGQFLAYKKTKDDKCFKAYSKTAEGVMEVFKDMGGGGKRHINPYISRRLLA